MDPKSFRTWEWASPPFRKDEWRTRERRKGPQRLTTVETAVRTMDYRFCARPVSLYMMTKKKNRVGITAPLFSALAPFVELEIGTDRRSLRVAKPHPR